MTAAVSVAQGATNNVSFRNKIINGAMNVWQRGTSFSSSGGGYYTADRWQTLSQIGTYSQSTDVPAGFKYSMSVSCSSSYYGTLCQRIESANLYDLVGQPVTVSFWAKATSGGTAGLVANLDYATAVDNFASTTNFASSTTAALTSTWTKYTITFSNLPSSVANGLQLYIFNAQGGAVAITYLITGVQLEAGTTATPFENRLYGTELALCQRYYQTWGGNSGNERLGSGFNYSGAQARVIMPLVVTMRTTPTLTTSAASDFAVEATGSLVACTSIALDQPSSKICAVNFNVASGLTAGQGCQATANATGNARFNLSAEL